ncbi:interleukin-15 receptor subunit alpha isoform X1 [Lemur catta]|uniref:interleukin-15 receptor subunit alpha isoform X1 n=1 Tax=Lemur catta TaxID=9447 RepID=UPI001E26BFC8|nr:interleukin-15 receptor subunit alpha isoform X1 [Lemur catta]
MPWLLPRGCPAQALPALLLLLLLRPPATWGITCPTPTSVQHADIRVKSYSVNSRERYVCISGFKRRAGTSSLTECVLNKTTNTAHWTTPNLECIRDPSLTHQRPVPFSTATTARVTPQPESPSPSGKASSPRPDTTVATETAMAPRRPSNPPSAGPTAPGRRESAQAPSRTTARTWEGTSSASLQPPGANPFSSRDVTVTISSSAVVLCVLGVALLACCLKSRQTSRPNNVEMETMEAQPMTSNREEDTETGPHHL